MHSLKTCLDVMMQPESSWLSRTKNVLVIHGVPAKQAFAAATQQIKCLCREYFVDMMQTIRRPMLLEECKRVEEEMDGKMYSIELMRFRFKEGSESVGVKTLRR